VPQITSEEIGEEAALSGIRTPVQRRSRETFDRILAAADAEIAEYGLAGTTTTAVARRAGVSVGALYRFFDDKTAIADALAQQYLADIRPDFQLLLRRFEGGASIPEAIMGLVDLAAAAQINHPGYYRLTEEVGPERDDSSARQVRTRLVALFVDAIRAAGTYDPHLAEVVTLCIETVRNTLARAPRDPVRRAVVVGELKAMLTAYLAQRLS
jgi:AcrR family transcriptional regulator